MIPINRWKFDTVNSDSKYKHFIRWTKKARCTRTTKLRPKTRFLLNTIRKLRFSLKISYRFRQRKPRRTDNLFFQNSDGSEWKKNSNRYSDVYISSLEKQRFCDITASNRHKRSIGHSPITIIILFRTYLLLPSQTHLEHYTCTAQNQPNSHLFY